MCGRYNQFGALSYKRRLRDFILGAGKRLTIQAANVLSTEQPEISFTGNLTNKNCNENELVPEKLDESEDSDDSDWEDFCEGLNSFLDDEEEETLTKDITEDVEVEPTVEATECIEVDDETIDDVDEILKDFESVVNEKNQKDLQFAVPSLPETEGFNYFSGYLGKSTEGLTMPDNNLVQDEHFVASEWIDSRNIGGMNYPRKSLVEDVKQMNEIFEKFHEDSFDGLKRDLNVTKDLTDILAKKYPQYDKSLLQRFSLSRSIFRMRYLLKQSTKESLRSKQKKVQMLYSKNTIQPKKKKK